MARKKTITREHILDATYQVVATEGFSGFTARNIASKMRSSTQPIYLEFKNMEDLRNAFFKEVESDLEKDVFSKEITGDALVDLCLNYVEFAKEQKMLYRALFVENYEGGESITRFIHQLILERMSSDSRYKNLSSEKRESLLVGFWIVATGLASLVSAERIQPTQKEISDMVNNCVAFSKESDVNFSLTLA
ncbi:TetR/AcrR family transcriptional regulator [Vagococcus sp.]|uniref:TetR/AcrR family transcriptional regulator n=1 Tax=Vagococcus sp. TaxID=1933889 RepID=UPI003F9BE3A9